MADENKLGAGNPGGSDSDKTQLDMNSPLHRNRVANAAPVVADEEKTQIDPGSPLHRKPAAAADPVAAVVAVAAATKAAARPATPGGVTPRPAVAPAQVVSKPAAPAAALPAARSAAAPAAPVPQAARPAAAAAAAGDRTQIDPNSPMHRRPAAASAPKDDITQPLNLQAASNAPAATNVPQATSPSLTATMPAAPSAAPAANVQKAALNTAPEDPTLALPVGYRIFEYRIDNVLGQGGFGITYMATDVNLNSRVAVKEYLPEQFAYRATTKSVSARAADDLDFYQHGLESFLVEARTLATFKHPNIVRVARFFEANNTAYMVLEYEKGKSLRSWWQVNAGLGEERLLGLLLPLIEGLGVVHRSGFLHRDIKPDNVIVRDVEGSFVLLDFGAARSTSVSQGDEVNIVTPGYGPVEQYWGGVQGPYTDIYALGATLYWMLTGEKPPEATVRASKDTMTPAVEAGKGKFSPEFLGAIDWALKVKPEERPQDLQQFATALFAAHASALGLTEALTAGEDKVAEKETWLDTLKSPRLLRRRVNRFGDLLFRPASWPMGVKMTLAMVATALLPMIITAYYNVNGSIDSISKTELKNLEQIAENVSGRITQLIDDTNKLAIFLGTDRDFVGYLEKPTDATAAEVGRKLANLKRSNPDVELVMVFDREGTAKIATDPTVQGRNFKFREYFKANMAGKPFVSSMLVGAATGQLGVFFAQPVRDKDDGVIGAVVMRYAAAPFEKMLSDARSGTRLAYLVDDDGVIVYHPDPATRFKSLAPLSQKVQDEIKADQRFRRDKIDTVNMPDLNKALLSVKEPGNISYVSTISKKDEIAGYAPVKGHIWVVAVSETKEEFSAPLDRIFSNVLYSVFLVGMVFLLLAMLFARSIVKPIQELQTAALALKSGDYDKASVRVRSSDEIGQLGRTFNVMIDVLRQRERERERAGSGLSRRSGS